MSVFNIIYLECYYMHVIVVFVIIALMLICRRMNDQFYHIEGLTTGGITGPPSGASGASGPAPKRKPKPKRKQKKRAALVNEPSAYKGNVVF
jgi:hypothetical protein